MKEVKRGKQIGLRVLAAFVIAVGLVVTVWSSLSSIVRAANLSFAPTEAVTPLTSALYRFDPATQSFLTISLPSGSVPLGIAVTGSNPIQIWAAEFGHNRIGRVVFTSTVDYQVYEYPVTSTVDSRPFRIAVQGNYIWFTERGADRVGRVNAVTGQMDEFYGHGLGTSMGLADIQVAPDGKIWLAAQQANEIICLTVNSLSDYVFQPFTHSLLLGPLDLAIENSDSIWFTALTAKKVGRLEPSLQHFTWPQIPVTTFGEPYEIVFQGSSSWTTDRGKNLFQEIGADTLTWNNAYGPISHPAGVAAHNSHEFWITQQGASGAVARFVITSPVSSRLDSYALPVPEMMPTGIDIAMDNTIWLGAYQPFEVYLPLVVKNAP